MRKKTFQPLTILSLTANWIARLLVTDTPAPFGDVLFLHDGYEHQQGDADYVPCFTYPHDCWIGGMENVAIPVLSVGPQFSSGIPQHETRISLPGPTLLGANPENEAL